MLKLVQFEGELVSLLHDVAAETDVGLPASATVFSAVTLA
jgi:hypothetical protein